MRNKALAGIYVAAVTPLKDNFTIDLEAIPQLMKFFAKRGCHGVLLSGPTGEGPSFSTAERREFWTEAIKIKQEYPYFRFMAGTGSPSIEQTIELNKIAFDLGFEAVVTLPPYYFRTASEQGLFEWFSQVINKSVSEGGWLFGYHIPQVSGVGLSALLLKRLRDAYPNKFGGIKDSSGDLDHAKEISEILEDRLVLVGNDRLLADNMKINGDGCITAMANLISPQLRFIWDAHQNGKPTEKLQEKVTKARTIGERYQPFPSSIKSLLSVMHGFPLWSTKAPLTTYPEGILQQVAKELNQVLNN